jgi:hypothetical protein
MSDRPTDQPLPPGAKGIDIVNEQPLDSVPEPGGLPPSDRPTDPDVARALESLEWIHYQASKSFPHVSGAGPTCELCKADEEIRSSLNVLAARLEAAEHERDAIGENADATLAELIETRALLEAAEAELDLARAVVEAAEEAKVRAFFVDTLGEDALLRLAEALAAYRERL